MSMKISAIKITNHCVIVHKQEQQDYRHMSVFPDANYAKHWNKTAATTTTIHF